MLSHSGLVKLHNTLTWKFSKPFSALDWNISILFFSGEKITIERYLFKWLPFLREQKWSVWQMKRVGWFLAVRPVIWPGFRQDRKVYAYKRIVSSSTCGISIFQVITSPPHFSKWVKKNKKVLYWCNPWDNALRNPICYWKITIIEVPSSSTRHFSEVNLEIFHPVPLFC